MHVEYLLNIALPLVVWFYGKGVLGRLPMAQEFVLPEVCGGSVRVLEVHIKPKTTFAEGDVLFEVLVQLEECDLTAECAGVVERVFVRENSVLDAGEPMFTYTLPQP